ncbi:class I SAM-dependent methyltransferase [Actinoplanes sp. L3-i22]|uniref:class I SAM-dependent methyltransferase n=1 Tax=Actinoplanes sp. L3-i22 TaxID=2836373 RepID=UPI001C793073|nr:methyltransferase domain-containing protein [Actinoplanes sp. L3-i22]BCY09062.1 hypothetical protein L3i22_041500 [Actinoplanes sp. L3-i22]
MGRDGEHRRLMEAAFGDTATTYDAEIAFFTTIAARTAAGAAARHGSGRIRTAVDVGAGTGALAAALREALRPERVIAVDISLGMLRAAGRHDDRVLPVLGDAADLPLPDRCAEVAGSATSVRFFDQPRRAAAELGRVLRPGGTVVLSELGGVDRKWLFLADLVRRAARRAPAGPPRGSLPRPVPLTELLADAGFVDVETAEETLVFRFTDEHQWWRWIRGQSAGAAIRQLPAAAAEAVERAALATAAGFADLELHQVLRIATARTGP